MNRIFFLVLVSFSLIFISCEKAISTSPDNIAPTNSKVIFNSIPSNMKIFKNGFYTGLNTPAELNRLEYQDYSITLKKELYRDSTFLLSIKDDSEINLQIDFHKNPSMLGKMLCESIPNNSKIIINDTLTNFETPHTFTNLVPGEYKVKYLFPDFMGYESNIIIRSNFQTRVYMNLVDTTTWVPYTSIDNELLYKNLTSLNIGKTGNLLIGTSQNGLLDFSDNSFTNYNSANSDFKADKVNAIFSDNQFSWVATDNGLFKYDGANFVNYNSTNSPLPSNDISTINGDNSGNIWIGFRDMGIAKFNGIAFEIFDETNSISSLKNVTTLSVDNQNNIWIGTSSNGVFKYDGSNFAEIPELNSLGLDIQTVATFENEVWITHKPKNDNIGGISYFNGASWQNYTSALPNNNISYFHIDNENTKYISTSSGLYIFKNISSIEFFDKNNTGYNITLINAAITNSKNEIWIATNGNGLFRYKKP